MKNTKINVGEKESLYDIERKKRGDRMKERDKQREKNAPKLQTKKEIQKKDFDNFDKNVEEFKKNPISEWNDEKILNEFKTYPNLRSIFFNVVTNQPTMNLMIRISLGYEEDFKSQVGKQLKKLRRMGLVKEILICESWWKNYLNKKFKLNLPISKIEDSVLKKVKIAKDTEERKRNNLIANSGFWILTELGVHIFPIIKKGVERG